MRNVSNALRAFNLMQKVITTDESFWVLVASDWLGIEAAKEKDMGVIASNFKDVLCSSELSLLNLELFTEIVNYNSLVIRTEYDVLSTIIRWLVIHGHSTDDGLRVDYGLDEVTRTPDVLQGITKEQTNILTSSLRLGSFNLADLKEGIILSRLTLLEHLEKSSSMNFFTQHESFNCKHQFHMPKGRCGREETYLSHSAIGLAMCLHLWAKMHQQIQNFRHGTRTLLLNIGGGLKCHFRGDVLRDKHLGVYLELRHDEKNIDEGFIYDKLS